MPEISDRQYQRCFISAPVGLALGVLPELLAERGITWQWAKDATPEQNDASVGIATADFALVVLNGTKADYRGAFDSGIAVGLGKPVLLIQTKALSVPIDFRQFTTVKASLSNNEALKFHLDLFLATPPAPQRSVNTARFAGDHLPRQTKSSDMRASLHSELERRAYDAIASAGGTVISEPRLVRDNRFRPDLLAWLGHLDAELLDPVVIEVRNRAEPDTARRLEEQLLKFMQSARIRTALVVTAMPLSPRLHQVSPNVIWLTIDKFETLAHSGRLGVFVRETRNRLLHGAQ